MACSTRKKLVRWCKISGHEEKDDIQCLETEKKVNPSILIYVQLKRGNTDSKRDKCLVEHGFHTFLVK
jgi:hypothetical protein